MSETVVPECSLALKRAHHLARPADMLAAPLLHVSTRPGALRDWFHAK